MKNMYKDPFELLSKSDHISSPPDVYLKVREIVDDSQSSFMDIAGAISKDSALSVHLLKIANSALYNFPSKIETLIHAISVIGTQQLLDLVLATSVQNQFKNFSSDFLSMDSFWRHSIACGIAARTIAIYRHEINVERFYLMGLFHDMGRLIMIENAPDMIREALTLKQKEKELLHKAEKKIFGFDHADVVGALLKTWKLPYSIEEVVSCHHNPLQAKLYPEEAAIIHLADIIITAMRLGSSRELFVSPLEKETWQRVKLPVSLLPNIWDQVDKTFEDTVQTFLKG